MSKQLNIIKYNKNNKFNDTYYIGFIDYVMSGSEPNNISEISDTKLLYVYNIIAFITDDTHVYEATKMDGMFEEDCEFLKTHRDFKYMQRTIIQFREKNKKFKTMSELEQTEFLSLVLSFIEFIFVEILEVDRNKLTKVGLFICGMLLIILIYCLLPLLSILKN